MNERRVDFRVGGGVLGLFVAAALVLRPAPLPPAAQAAAAAYVTAHPELRLRPCPLAWLTCIDADAPAHLSEPLWCSHAEVVTGAGDARGRDHTLTWAFVSARGRARLVRHGTLSDWGYHDLEEVLRYGDGTRSRRVVPSDDLTEVERLSGTSTGPVRRDCGALQPMEWATDP